MLKNIWIYAQLITPATFLSLWKQFMTREVGFVMDHYGRKSEFSSNSYW
jgi:hypothetical protein